MGGTLRIVVIGVGLIGQSIVLAARAAGHDVEPVDAGDDPGAAARADLVVLAAPIRANLENLVALRAVVRSRTLITDTGSTKASIVRAAKGMRFVGGHPVAGAASSGRDAARVDLFQGRRWILTPGEDAAPQDVETLRDFVSRLGAIPVEMAADHHDELFAYISHLPQFAISALMDVAGAAAANELDFAGSGLRDSTRLAASPPDIWRDIAHDNRGYVVEAIDRLIETLLKLRDDASGAAVDEVFERARRWRSRIEEAR